MDFLLWVVTAGPLDLD